MPSTDVYEKDGNLVVKAELPGMKKEDIEVTLDQGDLVIRGERKAESEVTEEDYYRLERSYGSFYRRLPLGFHVTAEQIAASYHDGVLEVRIPKPKQEQPQAKKIPVA
jgi:HSP20 family protein